MKVSDIITSALQRINVLQAGEVPSGEDMTDAFTTLNSLMGQWRLQRLTVPYLARTVWNLTAGKGKIGNPYTVGTGGDVNIARPSQPNSIVVRYQDTSVTPTLERPLTPLTDDAWAAIPQKDLTSPLPSNYYYQPTYTGSLGSLYLWLVPTSATLQGVIYAPAGMSNFAAVTDTIILPDGYDHFITENLAVHLAPEFRENLPIDPTIKESAEDAMRWVKTANFRMMDLSVDAALTTKHGFRYSILSDGS
jgi:hypothetical protein